jgi:hypothetical protein
VIYQSTLKELEETRIEKVTHYVQAKRMLKHVLLDCFETKNLKMQSQNEKVYIRR